ncbi:MAG TPA: MFS transporter, partial [Spirochaetia bacterium]|nr:MFS transporter [Spirochaetia bacterium]
MRKHIFTGTLGSAWGTVITGIILVFFGNAIGMSQFQWGILGGISAWVVVVQPLGALLGERAGSRKLVWFWTALTDRVLRLAAVAVSFLLWRAGHPGAYLVFMVGICVATLIGNLSPGPWYGWLATIIPREVQGTFWGRRDSWISLVVIAVILPSGLLMDVVPQGQKLDIGAVILAAASLLGFVDILVHGTIPEPPLPGKSAGGSFSGILVPLRDRRFRPWLLFTGIWNLTQGFGGALCVLYFMENLGFKNDLLGGMFAVTVTGLMGIFLAARTVGRLVDRIGIKRVLFMSYFFWCLIPGIWLFATPRTAILWVGLAGLIGGIFPAAANNAGVKLVTRFPAPEESGMYMAVSTMVGSIAGGFASLVAGSFLRLMGESSFTVLGLVVSAFPLLFSASFVLRLVTTFTLLPRVRVAGPIREEQRPFLLPLFFEAVPVISRVMRTQRNRRRARKSGEPPWQGIERRRQ